MNADLQELSHNYHLTHGKPVVLTKTCIRLGTRPLPKAEVLRPAKTSARNDLSAEAE